MEKLLFLSITFLVLVFAMTERTESKIEDLPNFHEVNKKLFRGGQPTEEGVKQLSKLGIKTVISFRDTQEKVLGEKKIVEANGMRFVSMPLNNWFKSKDHEIDAIIEEIRKPENQPVFVHCKRGADRTGTVVAVYRMKFDGWTAKQANSEAKEYGIGWWQVWMKDFIHDYYRDNIEKK